MSVKEICFAKTCTYRKQVGENKAFCMLPRCPYKARKQISKNQPKPLHKKPSVTDIVKRNRELGLIP